MYSRTYWGDDIRGMALDDPPFGPGFSLKDVENAAALRIDFTDLSDSGPDYTIFTLLGKDGGILAQQRIGGY